MAVEAECQIASANEDDSRGGNRLQKPAFLIVSLQVIVLSFREKDLQRNQRECGCDSQEEDSNKKSGKKCVHDGWI